MFCYEMHAHCREVSACGQSTALEMVEAYAKAGFAGIVFTDHFIHGNTAISRKLPWEERMHAYFAPYTAAKVRGKELGVDVIVCLEHAYGKGKEVLVYGDITPEVLAAEPSLATASIEEFTDFCHKQGWFVAQAHPYRVRDYIDMSVQPIPELLDGVEVYNHCNRPEENIKAMELCEQNGLIPISGSDTHSVSLCGRAGLAFPERIFNGKQLAEALFSGSGRLIVNGEIESDHKML